MGLAGARGAEEDDVLAPLQEGHGGQRLDALAGCARGELEVEALQGLDGRKAGQACQRLARAALARGLLGAQHRLQVVDVAHLLLGGLVGEVGIDVGHGLEPELGAERLDALVLERAHRAPSRSSCS